MPKAKRKKPASARHDPLAPVRLTEREQMRLALAESQRAADELARTARDAERARLATQALGLPPAAAGNRNDGTFHLAFVQMGQGDCAIMSTPAGRTVLIDCGTNSKDDELKPAYLARVAAVLSGPKFLQGTNVINIMILTHPDKDHFNRLKDVLPNAITAELVYHSAAIGDYGTKVSTWVNAHATDARFRRRLSLSRDPVNGLGANTMQADGAALPEVIRPAPAAGSKIDKMDGTLGMVILDEGANCKITLMAAGVAHDYVDANGKGDDDTAGHRNRGSIVTLVETFGRKILISGDATRSTERFLMLDATRTALLTGVDIVQVGHHGSNVTSSHQGFVDTVRPTHRAVISAGRKGVPTHHLPGMAVVDRYVQRFVTSGRAADAVSHLVSAWGPLGTSADPVVMNVTQPVFTTGSSGTLYFDVTPAGVIQ